MAKKIRTFVSIPLPPGLQKTLAAFSTELAAQTENVRWVSEELLHLTLVFVGDIDDVRVHDICQAVREACDDTEPFVATVAGVGFFPKPEKPQVIWAGIDEGSESVVVLREAIANSLNDARFRFDWKFKAHITLGRFNRGRFEDEALKQKVSQLTERPFGEFVIDRVIAYSSTLEKGSPVYVPLATIRL